LDTKLIKKLFKILVVLVVFLVAGDLILQLGYRIVKGKFTWEVIYGHEIFVIDFLEPTGDERFVTPIKDYHRSRKMGLETDKYGFRVGNGLPSTTEKNIVFLGDSIPFGWMLRGEETVPSMLGAFLKDSGEDKPIINAAVPSYSLNQAVYRYVYDIAGKFPVETVILQVYDPAQSFYTLKHEWDVTRNWFTGGSRGDIGVIKQFVRKDNPLRYSSWFYLYWRFSGFYFQSVYNTSSYTEEDIARYKDSITSSLNVLLENSSEAKNIILLPITRPQEVLQKISDIEKIPIDILNETFYAFTQNNPKVHFLDTGPLFKDYADEEIFLDSCCHLTALGAKLQAKLIKDYIFQLEEGNERE